MATKTTSTKQLKSTSSAYLTKDMRTDLSARLARIEGHVRAVREMLEEDESCEDLMTQLAAVRAATTQAIVKLFEGHMETCVTTCVQTGKGQAALGGLKGAFTTLLRQV
ncbi:MAG: metal-sensitive transcriptional regulator [Candidatus Eisenbacteria bacterium]|nr:metal-sensitive transcriptional regulator [Candidatus Eisenbacteria bacterium]